MLKIGILGGTFDPVHIGHLMLADHAATIFNLSKVLFIPSGRPPHKDISKITQASHRIAMIRLATSCNGLFETSTVECDSPGVSYTYATLDALRGIYGPDADFYYIVGSDVLYYITKFRNYRQVLDSCAFIASARPGAGQLQAGTLAREISAAHGARIELMDFPEIEISSSMIRDKIAAGESVRYMLPDKVIEYIGENGLYAVGGDTNLPGYWDSVPEPEAATAAGLERTVRPDAAIPAESGRDVPILPDPAGVEQTVRPDAAGLERIKRHVASKISAERYKHTLGVMDEAEKLAVLFGADPDNAVLAALLHDCMRDAPQAELIAFCEADGMLVTDLERGMPVLLHARAGAVEAKKLLGGANGGIDEAIACHTTGRENMDLLSKIIFTADAIEPGRDYDAARKARDMLYKKGGVKYGLKRLDEVVLYLLENQIAYIIKSGRPLHPDTVLARNRLIGGALREGGKT